MEIQHQNLADGKWLDLSLPEQLGNIGSEVGRALNWQKKNNKEQTQKALERGLELFDLTLSDKRLKYPQLKEVARARETVCDYFYNGNEYKTTPEFLNKYFLYFGILARS